MAMFNINSFSQLPVADPFLEKFNLADLGECHSILNYIALSL